MSGALSYGALHELSDARFKRNIEHLQSDALGLVMQLKVYTFSLRSDVFEDRHTGFLAQQVRPYP